MPSPSPLSAAGSPAGPTWAGSPGMARSAASAWAELMGTFLSEVTRLAGLPGPGGGILEAGGSSIW